jgi:hypothetical protein
VYRQGRTVFSCISLGKELMVTDMTITATEVFQDRLLLDWLPSFCGKRGYSLDGFVRAGLEKLSERDAADFIDALDVGLVTHNEGTFQSPMSKAREQIFWEGAKTANPRRITLWHEPIITIAVLRRLQRDHHWPADRLGLQSADWAFDLVAYERDNPSIERMACEVKKSAREINTLIDHMQHYLKAPEDILPSLKPVQRNAFKKVIGLRKTQAATFWAAGPDNHLRCFTVQRTAHAIEALIEMRVPST